MLLVIIGKTCSGKDKVVSELANNGFEKVTTYTTRPRRKGELPGITYHYISNEEFANKISSGFFLEYKTYEVADGSMWLYGSSLESLEHIGALDKKVIILTPDGYRDFLQKVFIPHKSIYLYANNTTIKNRLIKRGDSKDEADRRLSHDNADFKGIENEVDRIVYNNDGTDIKDVVNTLLNYLEKNK